MTVSILRSNLVSLVRDHFKDYTLAEVSIARGDDLVTLIKPYYREELLEMGYLERMVTTLSTNPSHLLEGCVVNDGVVYPEVTDEKLYRETMEGFKELLDSNPNMAANLAALTIWTAEGLGRAV